MSTSAATLLSRITSELTQPVRRDLSTDSLNRWLGWLTKLRDRIEQVVPRIKALSGNGTYSDLGKAKELATLADTVTPTFAWLGNIADDLASASDRLQSQLFTVESPIKDAVLRELRAQEVRGDVRDFTTNERDVTLLSAAQADRDEVVWALLNGPTPLISDAVKDRALTERAQRVMPDAYQTWTDLQTLRESMTSWRQHLSLWLNDLGGDPKTIADALRLPYTPPIEGRPSPAKGTEWAKAVLASVA